MLFSKRNLAGICTLFFILAGQSAFSQDKVYLTDGRVVTGTVKEVGPKQIKMYKKDRLDGPLYVIDNNHVDSIVYPSGEKDIMTGLTAKRDLYQNIPELNTVSGDIFGMVALSVSLSYERRTKNGLVGLRVPLYIGFIGGGIPGMNAFQPNAGVFYPQFDNGTGGFSIGTGFNPKFYLFRHRIARVFIGPETDIGYSKQFYYGEYNNNGVYVYQGNGVERDFSFAGLVRFGLMITPKDKFNLTIDGGVGAGGLFGGLEPLGWVGVWHIGFALGGNF